MARRSRARPLIFRGFTLPEVLVALAVGGFVITALMAVQVQLARAGVRVSRLSELVVAGLQVDKSESCSVGQASPAGGVALFRSKPMHKEIGQAVRTGGRPAPGIGYTAFWSSDHKTLLGTVGQRCGLPERCEYDVAGSFCRGPGKASS